MEQYEQSSTSEEAASYRAAIQREIVQLHKQFFGRGPVKTKLYLHDDCAIVLMYEGHMPAEQTLLEHGGRRSVAQTRVDLSESMRNEFIAVIERHTGRKVVGFMSSSQQEPSLLSHVYVLAPTDLLAAVPEEPTNAEPLDSVDYPDATERLGAAEVVVDGADSRPGEVK